MALMYSLLIETSTERSCIAFAKENEIVFHSDLPQGHISSTFLLPEIERGLNCLCIVPQQLSSIAVGIGPGSYTGIRVGAITAKTLSYTLKIPLIGICSLETFIPSTDGTFAVIVDAKIGGIYLQKGDKQGKEIRVISEPAVVPLDQFGTALAGIQTLVTPQKHSLLKRLEQRETENSWQWEECGPNPQRMQHLSLQKWTEGCFSTDAHLDLLYLRKTQAEIEKAKGR